MMLGGKLLEAKQRNKLLQSEQQSCLNINDTDNNDLIKCHGHNDTGKNNKLTLFADERWAI